MYILLAVIAFLIIWAFVTQKHCLLGAHDWYTAFSCATYSRTGPLPGEFTTHNGLGQGGYRYERHCHCCYRLEYSMDGVWTEFKLPEGETLFNSSKA